MPPVRPLAALAGGFCFLTVIASHSVRAQTPPKTQPAAAKPAAKAAKPQPSPKAAKRAAFAKPAASAKPAAKPSASPEHLAVAVRLTDGHTALSRTRRELGFAMKSGAGEPVVFAVDLASLKASLTRIAPAFHRDTAEPRPVAVKGVASLLPGRDGQVLNVPTTAQSIVEAVAKDPATTKFPVTVAKKSPQVPASRYKGIDAVLATFSTKTSANAKRNNNVGLATSRIDGRLLAPQEIFSLNKTVGERTQASGFLTAPVFVNAELQPGIGGGVSQVTGTLFNAAARAGLKILEVNPHSRPVPYIPVGYDATVAWGDKDLKFQNNTPAPVYLDYKFDLKSRHLTATIFGQKVPGRVIRLQANVDELAPGKIDAQLYRITKKSGKIVSKEKLFTHHYRWDPSKKE